MEVGQRSAGKQEGSKCFLFPASGFPSRKSSSRREYVPTLELASAVRPAAGQALLPVTEKYRGFAVRLLPQATGFLNGKDGSPEPNGELTIRISLAVHGRSDGGRRRMPLRSPKSRNRTSVPWRFLSLPLSSDRPPCRRRDLLPMLRFLSLPFLLLQLHSGASLRRLPGRQSQASMAQTTPKAMRRTPMPLRRQEARGEGEGDCALMRVPRSSLSCRRPHGR